MFSGLIKKSFFAVNENPSVTLTLVLYLIALNLVAGRAFMAQTFITTLLFTICLFLISAVFFAGWINILKETTDREKIKEKNFMGIFLEGAGKNIIPVSIGTLLYMLVLVVAIVLATKFAQVFIGSLDFLFQDMTMLSMDGKAFYDYMSNLPVDKLYIMYGWQITYLVFITAVNFLFMFYLPALAEDIKHNAFTKAFVAFKNSIVFMFKKFLLTIGLFFLICIVCLFLNIARVFVAPYMFFAILFLLVYIYFISYTIMIIFNCYEQKNCCNHGPDSLGENEACDKSGEEN